MVVDSIDIVFQEVPDEISLCFSIVGCSLKCPGCHSPQLWSRNHKGDLLNTERYKSLLQRYEGFATCILFMGGEWRPKELLRKLKMAQEFGFKTCLYTGEETIPDELSEQLNYLKTGRWDYRLGGLESSQTNQKFTNVNTGEILNYKFQTTRTAT